MIYIDSNMAYKSYAVNAIIGTASLSLLLRSIMQAIANAIVK